MNTYIPNSFLFSEEKSKAEKLADAIFSSDENILYAASVNLWNAAHDDDKIYYVGDDFDRICTERKYTPTQIVERSAFYSPNDFLFHETLYGGFESFEYLEEQNFFDYVDLAKLLIEKDIDGGYDFVREILDEKETY